MRASSMLRDSNGTLNFRYQIILYFRKLNQLIFSLRV